MKRWGFGGQPATHGVSLTHRSVGSTGNRQTPGRVFKGKKMPGHMGVKQRTAIGLMVLKVDPYLNTIYVKGAVPGPKNGWVKIFDTPNQECILAFYKIPHKTNLNSYEKSKTDLRIFDGSYSGELDGNFSSTLILYGVFFFDRWRHKRHTTLPNLRTACGRSATTRTPIPS